MNRLLLAGTFLTTALPAFAADLPVRSAAPAPVVVAPVFSWAGFYVGANIGGAWGNVKEGASAWEDPFGTYTAYGASSNSSGVIGGIGAGYNFQSGAFVYGLEIDGSLANVEGSGLAASYDPNFGPSDRLASKTTTNGLVTGRIRLGYAANDWLFYATGGVAWGHVKRTVTQLDDGLYYAWLAYGETNSFSDWKFGWTLGAGIEKALTSNLIARLQYLYTDLGSVTYNYVGNPFGYPDVGSQKVKVSQSAVTVGLYYKFGGPAVAPVVARY